MIKYQELDQNQKNTLFNYILHLADNELVLGHRISEWCGHGPMLEEDIALANMALDCIGQANNFYILAATVEGKNRSEDELAFLRDTVDYKNFTMLELPRGDFGFTIMRLFLFSMYTYILYQELSSSKMEELSAIAQKSLKEVKYHARHCSEWVLRLGDGTEESHGRIQTSLDELWRYTSELFVVPKDDMVLIEKEIIPNMSQKYDQWLDMVKQVLKQATLTVSDEKPFPFNNGRIGKHTEYLGHMLAEMQILQRSHPGATW